MCKPLNFSINVDGLEPELKRIATLLYEGKLKPGQIDAAMVKKIAAQLMAAINDGYGKATTAEAISFIKKLESNVYVFSGFKNYQQLKETSLLMVDGKGSFTSFNEFLGEVKKINETYNQVYLEAEYNNALASAQSASNWDSFINNGIETLMFQTAGDDRVRDDHAVMDGIVAEITDPMLNQYNTPLDWGCRCEWIPAAGEPVTGFTKSELPELKPMFSTNIAKTGVIFPDTHPYFDVSKSEAKNIRSQIDEIRKTDK